MRFQLLILTLGLALSGCSFVGGDGSANIVDPVQGVQADAVAGVQAASPKGARAACPQVRVRSGAEVTRSYDGEQASQNVRYQISIDNVVRECVRSGNQVSVTVTIAGRALLGPKGSAGSKQFPVRIALVDSDFQPVTGNVSQRSLTLGQGEWSKAYTEVLDPITIQSPVGAELRQHIVFVGFETELDDR